VSRSSRARWVCLPFFRRAGSAGSTAGKMPAATVFAKRRQVGVDSGGLWSQMNKTNNTNKMINESKQLFMIKCDEGRGSGDEIGIRRWRGLSQGCGKGRRKPAGTGGNGTGKIIYGNENN